MLISKIRFLSLLLFIPISLHAADFNYENIAKRYNNAALSNEQVANAKMQGECLVGLKELNFTRTKEFDPVAEWTNFRSISLLEQYSPCEVLLMVEVAKSTLQKK